MKSFAAIRALAAQGPIAATVRGGSMAPLLLDGDRVAIGRARFYLPGDVVAFHAADGRLIVHRLLGYRLHHGRLACVTRGDAAPLPDPPVPLDRLLGRVVGPRVSLRARGAAMAAMAAIAAWAGLALRACRRRLRLRGRR